MIKLFLISLFMNPYILLSECKTTLLELSRPNVVPFNSDILWNWEPSEAVSELQVPMSDSFKYSFRKTNHIKQVIYRGELHLLLVALGNVALLRFEDKVIVWSEETDVYLESAVLTENNIFGYDYSGFQIIINTDKCNEEN